MEFYKEILSKILAKEMIQDAFLDLPIDATEIVELASYQALEKIKQVLEDDSLKDAECFKQIEAIICVFESLGSDGGGRHDFG